MRFDSLYFLLFFLAVFGLSRIRHIGSAIYIIASFLFYIVAGWQDLALIVSLIVVNYVSSLFVTKNKLALYAAITVNLSALLYFKYSSFIGSAFLPQQIFNTDIIIPLGISFYVFQMIAYQVDLVRGNCDIIKSFPRFFLFIGFFPQLVAGPIVRAGDISGQIDKLFTKGPRKNIIYSLGIALCFLGLFKKVILADSLAPLADLSFAEIPANAVAAWEGALLFGFQIYYDFSGYSDMALGLGYLLGIRLPINFRQPYLSKNPQEFWTRWHITLSSWVRDYLYIPLGGNRVGGYGKQILLLLFVMGIMGLWHGANWTFALWGIGWGAAIAFWRICGPVMNKIPGLSWFLTMVVAFTLWVFFRAPDISFALGYIRTMFSFNLAPVSPLIGTGFLLLALFHIMENKVYNIRGVRILKNLNTAFYYGLFGGLCLLIVLLPKMIDNPFIYFRF